MTPEWEEGLRHKVEAAADGVRFDATIGLDGVHHALDLTYLLAALDEARRERDAYKRAKAENDERFMRERDEARQALAALLDAHASPSDAARSAGRRAAMETRRGWGM